MKFITAVAIAIYLGIGAMLHALFVGSHFDWSSAWTFGWLLGWPIMIVIGMFVLSMVFMAIVFPVIWIQEWNEARQARNRRLERMNRNPK